MEYFGLIPGRQIQMAMSRVLCTSSTASIWLLGSLKERFILKLSTSNSSFSVFHICKNALLPPLPYLRFKTLEMRKLGSLALRS
jgi:hypothetical protein